MTSSFTLQELFSIFNLFGKLSCAAHSFGCREIWKLRFGLQLVVCKLLSKAPERLHINPELNGKCVAFLEWAFTAIKSKEDGAIHSMLLINNKLLSLFSEYDYNYCIVQP